MGSILISYPDISDADLVFDESEATDILRFFWPGLNDKIASMIVTTDTRRFAQTLLIAAVDASYAMGFIHGLANVITRRKPGTSLKVLVKKLARRYMKHWWKHATQEDLLDAKIYESVRQSVAAKNKPGMEHRLEGLARLHQRPFPFHMAGTDLVAWS